MQKFCTNQWSFEIFNKDDDTFITNQFPFRGIWVSELYDAEPDQCFHFVLYSKFPVNVFQMFLYCLMTYTESLRNLHIG